ncbi:MAG: cardiolipin synthase [Wenzhouxiangella sp.]|nr:MAG: cardiolipin synthase [Wenzhouxiangella sp.]
MLREIALPIVLHAVLATLTALHAMLYKRDPRAAFGWIGVCLVLPLAGPMLYILFGLNRSRGRAQRLGLRRFQVDYERGLPPQPTSDPGQSVPRAYRNLVRVGQALSRHELSLGNQVEVLVNGDQAFPAMLEAIATASSHILFSSYLFDNDRTGRRFREALQAAADRGVDVRVLIDGFGDWYSFPRASRRLRGKGVRVARFLPPRLLPPSLSINMRNHQKNLVVDDQVAFTGGMNIGDRHCLDTIGNQRPTADLHFRIRGPATGQMRSEFLRLWRFSTGQTDVPTEQVSAPVGDLACRAMADGPDEDLDRLTVLLCAALSEARHSIRIMTPYFLPPRELVGAIQSAAIRGVSITLVLPARNNLPYVHWATRNMLWEVLLHGVRVIYQPPPFNHAKLLVIDDHYSLIGSANWDPRSLRLNFELQLEVYGQSFASALVHYIDQAAASGREVTLEEVDQRSLPVRTRDAFCWLFTPYL